MGMNINWLWIKDPVGDSSVTVTFAVVSMAIIVFKLAFGGSVLTLPHFVWNIQTIDAGMVTALLGSTLTAYVARRYTDKKFDTDGDGIPDSDEPKK